MLKSRMVPSVTVAAVAGLAMLALAQTKPAAPAPKPAANATAKQPAATVNQSGKPKPATTGAEKPAPATSAKPAATKAPPADGKSAGKPADDADEQAIRATAEAFAQLYNAHDAKGAGALFALKAEFTDEEGTLIKGREAIEAEFARQFEDEPDCTISVDIDSIRVLTPNIAVEEGIARSASAPDEPASTSGYTCVHVKVDGKWMIVSVSDFAAESDDLTPHEHLQELSWLLGDWIDESPDSNVLSHCDWDDSGNFLLNHFAVQFAGAIAMHGTTRIGWDAVKNQFRSWLFDSEGGFTEGLWSRQGDEWIVKTTGATPDGETCSSTNVYRLIDDGTFTFRSYDRIVDGELTDDIDEVVIKRRPPAPVEEAGAEEPAAEKPSTQKKAAE